MIQKSDKILRHENYETKILLNESQIQNRVRELGQEISNDYTGRDIVLVGTLIGSFIFMADLCREIELDCKITFLQISSYQGEKLRAEKLILRSDINLDIKDKNVIVVEDIVDSGFSLKFLRKHIGKYEPKSLRVVSLLSKPGAHKIPVYVDYLGFEIENKFVIGYGLDFAEHKRNLKDIHTVNFKKES